MLRGRLSFSAIPLLIFFSVLCCRAQDAASDITTALQNEYQGKVLIIRGFYSGAKLQFDSTGNIVGEAMRGYWSSDALVQISSISLRDEYLHFIGQRLISRFDTQTGVFKDSKTEHELNIDIRVDPGWKELSGFESVLNKVFTTDRTYLASEAPDYWGCWLSGPIVRGGLGWRCTGEGKVPMSLAERTAYRVGGGVSAPRVLTSPDPAYTSVAQKAKFQGTSVLFVVVNEAGEATEIQIAEPLGGGLDDRAVEAVRKWKFSPAMKDGHPVPVKINVEINFKLY